MAKPNMDAFDVELRPEYAEWCERGQEGECGVTYAIWQYGEDNPDAPHMTHVKTNADGAVSMIVDGYRGIIPPSAAIAREALVFDHTGILNQATVTIRADLAKWIKVKRKMPARKVNRRWEINKSQRTYRPVGPNTRMRTSQEFMGTIDDVHATFPDFAPRRKPSSGNGDVGARRQRFADSVSAQKELQNSAA